MIINVNEKFESTEYTHLLIIQLPSRARQEGGEITSRKFKAGKEI